MNASRGRPVARICVACWDSFCPPGQTRCRTCQATKDRHTHIAGALAITEQDTTESPPTHPEEPA